MRLAKLHIENFGCIGNEGTDILVDDIVVLIGPNDVGKSTILDAYEAFASMGSPLTAEQFCSFRNQLPVSIEAVFANVGQDDIDTLGEKWIHEYGTFGEVIRVRWQWQSPDSKGVKQSFDPSPDVGEWVNGGVGGWDTLIQSRIPVPLRIYPNANAQELEDAIREILMVSVKASLKIGNAGAATLLDQIQELSVQFRDEVSAEIDQACASISERISQVFPGYLVGFEPSAGKVEPEKLIGTGSYITIRSPNDEISKLSRRGTGIQRSFLWSALSALAELGHIKAKKKRIDPAMSRILLVDEPESFLHPPAIRRARDCLYSIAQIEGWQVMCSTHSPVFIDVSKPHTTIVRISREDQASPRAFQTDKANFTEQERKQLQMVRACDPSVCEFFFAERVILVEGETEHLVFGNLLERHAPDQQDQISVINARGKGNLVLFMKILNQFDLPYVVVHDSDSPRVKREDRYIRNAMWTVNHQIAEAMIDRQPGMPACALVAHIPDFEGQIFGRKLTGDKPYAAMQEILRKDYYGAPELTQLRELCTNVLAGTCMHSYATADDLILHVTRWVEGQQDLTPEVWDLEGA